jgi:hypothetical protein
MLGRRVTLREAAILVPVAFVSLTAARHTPLLAIAAAPYFASAWPDPLDRWRSAARDSGAGRLGRAAVALASAAVLAVTIALADAKLDESGYPRAALAALPGGPGSLNQYDWGGYLIYAAPATPVFIDGRLFPYVPSVLEDYRTIVGARPGWQEVAARRGVRAMIVRPTDAIAVRAPERGWLVAYADQVAVVLVRTPFRQP